VDVEVFMLYATYLGRAGARACLPDALGIALGVTGGGVHRDEPAARSRHVGCDELEPELRAAVARWLLRGEPLWDRLLPARRAPPR
jgi:hypothetical protein